MIARLSGLGFVLSRRPLPQPPILDPPFCRNQLAKRHRLPQRKMPSPSSRPLGVFETSLWVEPPNEVPYGTPPLHRRRHRSHSAHRRSYDRARPQDRRGARRASEGARGYCAGGLEIPRKPIPATVKEIQAELEIVSRLELEAYEARIALPPGPERESAGAAMVYYRDRCSWLRCAIRDRSSDGDDLA